MSKSLALAAFALFLVIPSAQAGQMDRWGQIGLWTIQYDDSICVAVARYNSGYDMGFAVTKEGRFSLVFGKDGWEIPKGKYSVSVKIDSGSISDLTAHGTNGHIIYINIELTKANVNLLRYGSTMHVKFGRESASFNLTKTAELLPELFRCSISVANSGSSPSNNPFATGSRRNPFD